MRIVDFHSHFFSRPFFDALAAQSPLEDPLARLPCELPPEDLSQHLARWISEMDEKGCDHMVAFASLPEEIPAVGEAAAASNGRLTPVGLVNPHMSQAVPEGFAGVLLFPAMHHFKVAEQRELLGALDERGGLCYVHCGLLVVRLRDLMGLPRPYDLSYANPLDVIPAANAFRNVKFVIPHFGAGFFREALMAGTQCENIYVDTSSSNSWAATNGITLKDVFERALEVFGPERILFGTDSNVFPAGWQKDRLDEQSAVLDALAVSPEDKALIFGGNAEQLLS